MLTKDLSYAKNYRKTWTTIFTQGFPLKQTNILISSPSSNKK